MYSLIVALLACSEDCALLIVSLAASVRTSNERGIES